MKAETGGLSFPDEHRLELDEALATLVTQAERVKRSHGRLRALLRASQTIVEEIDLPAVLRRIVEAAADLVDAEYGALGVVAADGDSLEEFVHVGLSPQDAAAIGPLPTGHGLLGALIADPRPIRLPRIADDPRAAGFPAHHPSMESFLGVPIRVRGEVFGNLYLTNRRQGVFTREDEQLVSALATTAGYAVQNARLFAQAKVREIWMTAAAELSASLLSSSAESGFDLIAGRMAELPEVEKVSVLLTESESGRLRVAAARGSDELKLRGAVVGPQEVAASTVLEDGRPLALPPAAPPVGDPLRVTRDGVTGPAVVVPLRTHARLWGVVCLARGPGARRFSPSELDSAVDLASRACIALELAGAREESQRSMLMDDRRRIARDLHDHVIQQLFGIGLSLQTVASGARESDEGARLDAAVEQLDDAISQIRTVVFALSRHEEGSIRHQIIDLVADVSTSLSRPPAIRFSGPVDHAVGAELADDLLGVTRELLSNAARHAHADRISVELAVDEGWVSVCVADNGIGFSMDAARGGLINLADRATARRGEFSVDSSGAGTSAVWRAPALTAEQSAVIS